MDLFVLVIAILFHQVWGDDNPLHKDAWLQKWQEKLQQRFSVSPAIEFFLVVGLPILALAIVFWLIALNSYWLLLPLGIVCLLYSFGRGEFSEIIHEYTNACVDDDWEYAVERANNFGVKVEGVSTNDWQSLHQHVLEQAAYRGFERMFAVLFWFFILGPVGAILYRLVFLFNQNLQSADPVAAKVLWGMEWPAARVVGISFALTGNFIGCINQWSESAMCFVRPTEETLGKSVLGALSVDDDVSQTCDVTRKELELLDGLFRRTLWLWIAAAAVVIILV